MNVLIKIIALTSCSIFLQSCMTSDDGNKANIKLKDEKPLLIALKHIENTD